MARDCGSANEAVHQACLTPTSIRLAAGYATPRLAAEAAGVSAKAIRKYEAGRWRHATEATRNNWLRLAEAYGVDVQVFVGLVLRGKAS